ncbi:hypothetical protein PISMIDRAFT_28412 [Pisolithus microcarpus 441]|uniref:Rho-GAP domain-containing protein n=1 Tax=Pisolithus microcarpus 441 TaxID=765257 RepID=A0A0C9ZBA7_9AGAM|nr:hypothetical protein BKA83DRAFT_28412 [Pisolithus microcarpus]KIK26486.1 hypothetical protein PISMIDRAFT_28412 [Pisolithus microcarpus 441]
MSTTTTDSARASISDQPAQSGPVPLFDQHLKVLSDSYLYFFQERKRIEEVYVESLLRLHRKVKSTDAWLDDRSNELSSARRAWSEVVDNVDREAQTRQAFLTTLTEDAVNALTMLKETQERTRKRIKDDLKESGNAYADYADNALPKLKRTYLRKCQEVEDYKAAAATPTPNAQNTPYLDQAGGNVPSSRSNPNLPAPPVVTGPQALRPLDRRPSGTAPGPRNRSPSSGTFSDFAQHGKKQLNQLMTFLDKGGNVRETLGVRSENNALRTVRAKREAEEADKEYRKGVHRLETLRLRKTKILESAYGSLKTFIHEYATTVKIVLEKYVDNLMATSVTHTQLSEHARAVIQKISPEKDLASATNQLPRSLEPLIPKPILYYNYNVGECNDLIFGVSLVDYATSRGLSDCMVPRIVQLCISEVDRRGLETEGIYRVSGRHAVVQDLQHKVERDEGSFKFNPLTDDVYAVASLLKLYLRELPEPLFKYPLLDRGEYAEPRAEHSQLAQMRSKIRRLPAIHRETLRAIIEHLARVAGHSEKNKMDIKNLAIVFGNVIFGEDELAKGGDLLSMQHVKDTRMEDLILNAPQLFEEHLSSSSPPLPAAPAGEVPPVYQYGSSHTKIASVPPPLPPAKREEDFSPVLPPRPTSSIHPSLRANPISPIRATTEIPPLPRPRSQEEQVPSPNTRSRPNDHFISQPPSPPQSPQTSVISLPSSESPTA